MIKCGLDLGGSKLRYGVSRNLIRVMDSKVLEIEPSAPVKEYASDDTLSDFVIVKHPMTSLCGRRFVRGDALDNYRGDVLFCDNQDSKCNQEITYINAAYGIAQDCVLNYYNEQEVQVTACIPTAEYFSEEGLIEKFKNNLTGEYEIKFPRINQTVTFTVLPGNVTVTPEGVVAAYHYAYVDGFARGVTLIIDVGSRSTDITVLRNFKPIGNSAVSRTKGGMNIISIVRSSLERDSILLNSDEIAYAFEHRYIIQDGKLVDVTDIVSNCINVEDAKAALLTKFGIATTTDVDNALNKYYIRQGSGFLDITPYVTKAKKVFCSSVKNDILEVLSTDMSSLASVNNILPMGRSFFGDVSSPDNMANILMQTLYPAQDGEDKHRAQLYADISWSLGNIQEIMNVVDGTSGN